MNVLCAFYKRILGILRACTYYKHTIGEMIPNSDDFITSGKNPEER